MTRLLLILVACSAAFAMGDGASAQIRPPYQRISIEDGNAMIAALELTGAEEQLLLAAHGRYVDEIEASLIAMRALNRWNSEHRVDLTYFRDTEETSEERARTYNALEQTWQFGVRDLERQFFDDLRAIAPEKLDVVDSLARAQRRKNTIQLYGVYYDFPQYLPLFDVVGFARDELPADIRTAEIEAVLIEYEVTADSLLIRMDELRIHWLSENQRAHRAVKEMAEDGPVSFDDVKRSHFADILECHRLVREVREVERRALTSVAGLLPPPYAETFRTAHDDHLMNWIEEEGAALAGYLDQALARDSLADEARARLAGIGRLFESQRKRAISTLVPQLRALHDMKHMEARCAELVRIWQTEGALWVDYEPAEFLEYEEDRRLWREQVRAWDREARSILGEPVEEDSP